MSKLLPFYWYGGKFSHLKWLLPLLPKTKYYCEPFGGSAAVLLNREPSEIETYNDLSKDVVNFFRCLREMPEALMTKLIFTPFSRAEFVNSLAITENGQMSAIERARLFFVNARQVRNGRVFSATESFWSYSRSMSRRGMAKQVSGWLSAVDGLEAVASRLLTVQIECRPAVDVVRTYDTGDTLFYCDPPYPAGDRNGGGGHYGAFEMTHDEHCDLTDALHRAKGKVAVSGYHGIYDDLYHGWTVHEREYRSPASRGNKIGEKGGKRTEVLWTNY